MKTIKETLDKWNEMYDLVIGNAADAANAGWQQVYDVFAIDEQHRDSAKAVIHLFTKTWDDWKDDGQDKLFFIWMNCIAELLHLSSQSEYAFYLHNGIVGVLCELDTATIANAYDWFNGIAFVPGNELHKVADHALYDLPHLTEDDMYSGYCGIWDIEIDECANLENDEQMYFGWWSTSYVMSDEFRRMFGPQGRFTSNLRDRLDIGDISIDEARKEWAEVQEDYEDPLSCEDFSFDAIFKDYIDRQPESDGRLRCAECGKPIAKGYVWDGKDVFCTKKCLTTVFNGDRGCVNILIDEGRIEWVDDLKSYEFRDVD